MIMNMEDVIAFGLLPVFVSTFLTYCRYMRSYIIHASRISCDGSALLFGFVILKVLSCATIIYCCEYCSEMLDLQILSVHSGDRKVGIISRRFEDEQH